MAITKLGSGSAPNAQGAATVVDGVNTVPASKLWEAKVIVFNTGSSARTVTCGFTDSGSALAVGEYLMNAESMASKERREFGIRGYAAGFVFRLGQGTADADVQWEIHGIESDA